MDKERPKTRPTPFSIRLTAAERAQLQQEAGRLSIAAHVKAVLFKDTPRKQVRGLHPVKDHQALGEVLARLGASRISSNLNQLAYAANTGTLTFDPTTTQQLNEAYQHVREIRDLLITSLGLREAVDAETAAMRQYIIEVAARRAERRAGSLAPTPTRVPARAAFNRAATDHGDRS